MLSSLVVLAVATMAAAWPFTLYSDINCTSVVAAYSHLPEETCINTWDVQSYKGSLGSDKQEFLIYKEKSDCDHKQPPGAVIDGTPQSCIFIYKHVGPFGAAKVAPVQSPPPRISQQD